LSAQLSPQIDGHGVSIRCRPGLPFIIVFIASLTGLDREKQAGTAFLLAVGRAWRHMAAVFRRYPCPYPWRKFTAAGELQAWAC